jgi:hypothetical protein
VRRWLVLTAPFAVLADLAAIDHLAVRDRCGRVRLLLASAVAAGAALALLAMLTRSPLVRPTTPPSLTQTFISEPSSSWCDERLGDAKPPADPLNNSPWAKPLEECVAFSDELGRIRPCLDETGQDFAEDLSCRLQAMLERTGLAIISGGSTFDRYRHQPAPPLETIAGGATIHETLSPGFTVGRRVFRGARNCRRSRHPDTWRVART